MGQFTFQEFKFVTDKKKIEEAWIKFFDKTEKPEKKKKVIRKPSLK